MRPARRTPSFRGLSAASPVAKRVAKRVSAKRNTQPELLLRRALWARGLRYRVDVPALPGRPDIVLTRARVAIFCDGDFWHGRDMKRRLAKLRRGHNASYWVAKIRTNSERDRKISASLESTGWRCLRFWESDLRKNPNQAAQIVAEAVRARASNAGRGRALKQAHGVAQKSRIDRVTKPTVISLFTGAGGLDLGFHAAGLRTAVAVEMDSDCCETLRANTGREHSWEVIQAPIEEVSSREILAAGGLKSGEVDVLIGGPPCQPFSKSGYWSKGDSGRLKDPRANTLSEYFRVVRETRPRVFLLENVSGLAYTGKEEGFRFVLEAVERINAQLGTRYRVSAKVVNAAWYGVPQTRERIILVASRDGKLFTFPDPRFVDPEIARDDLMGSLEPYRTAWDALGDLGEPQDIEETAVRGKWGDLLPSIPEGANYLHHTARGGGWPLFGWRRRYWSFLLKLAKRRAAWTLTAQPGPAIGPFHWKNRRLTRVELMRLQTIPDGYVIRGSISDVQRQVGNAVPSLLAEVLALEIRRQLLGHHQPTGTPSLLPPKRLKVPRPEPVRPVPKEYLKLVGSHDAHPGTGLGYGALRRAV